MTVVHRTRAVNFGRALAGGRDLTGDCIPDLIVSAPGASEASDGGGAVFLYAGGAQSPGQADAVADRGGRCDGALQLRPGPRRSTQGGASSPPTLVIGAPTSYRTGTQNGTAFALPLGVLSGQKYCPGVNRPRA